MGDASQQFKDNNLKANILYRLNFSAEDNHF